MIHSSFTVSIESSKSRDALALLERLDEQLLRLYPAQSFPDWDPKDIHSLLVVARVDSRCVGCGIVVLSPNGQAEIKRIFVESQFRGQGIARAILRMFETESRNRDVRLLKIDVGSKQPELVKLLESSGYSGNLAVGQDRADPFSLLFEKHL